MNRNVHVVGVGMIPFTKPGASDPYTVMGARAAIFDAVGRDHRHSGQASMTALLRDDEPVQEAQEEPSLDTMEILSAWDCIRVQSKAGDIGRVRYRDAIGIAIAKATNKSLRNEVIRGHYTLVPEETLARPRPPRLCRPPC